MMSSGAMRTQDDGLRMSLTKRHAPMPTVVLLSISDLKAEGSCCGSLHHFASYGSHHPYYQELPCWYLCYLFLKLESENNIHPTIMDNNILTITPNQIIMGVNTNHQEIVSNPPKGTNFPAIKINVAPTANNLILYFHV
jgi:hypothetical protein